METEEATFSAGSGAVQFSSGWIFHFLRARGAWLMELFSGSKEP